MPIDVGSGPCLNRRCACETGASPTCASACHQTSPRGGQALRYVCYTRLSMLCSRSHLKVHCCSRSGFLHACIKLSRWCCPGDTAAPASLGGCSGAPVLARTGRLEPGALAAGGARGGGKLQPVGAAGAQR